MLAQCAHAVADHIKAYPEDMHLWQQTSNTVVILAVNSQIELQQFVTKIAATDLNHTPVIEPDLNNEVTAVSLSPGSQARKLCSCLPLATFSSHQSNTNSHPEAPM